MPIIKFQQKLDLTGRKTLGIRWLTTYTRKRGERTMRERLAKEIMDAANGAGASVKEEGRDYKMAEANRSVCYL